MPQFDFLNEVSGSYDHAKDKMKGLGGAEFSMFEAESDSERSAGASSMVTSEGAIHSYPMNLDSAEIDKPQECIRFTAVKQGGLSLEGDEYTKNMAAAEKENDARVFDRMENRALTHQTNADGSFKKSLEERNAQEANFHNQTSTTEGRAKFVEDESLVYDKIVTVASGLSKSVQAKAKDLEHCFLYMPPAVTFTEGATWGSEELGALGKLTKDALTGKGGGIDTMLKNFGGGAAGDLGKAGATAAGAGMAGLLGGAAGYLTAGGIGTGMKAAGRFTTNPYEEQMFNGIPFRSFTFDFTFTPNSVDEGKQVFNIIRMFRFHSRPGYVGGLAGEGLFSFPNEFRIQFNAMRNGAWVQNSVLPKIHNCVCTNVTTNYTPEGFWVAMRDGRPMSTTLSLGFNETVKITQKEVKGGY